MRYNSIWVLAAASVIACESDITGPDVSPTDYGDIHFGYMEGSRFMPSPHVLDLVSSSSPITVKTRTYGGGKWLSVSPSRTNAASATVRVIANPGSSPVGRYIGFVSASSPNSNVLEWSVVLEITKTPTASVALNPEAVVIDYVQGSKAPDWRMIKFVDPNCPEILRVTDRCAWAVIGNVEMTSGVDWPSFDSFLLSRTLEQGSAAVIVGRFNAGSGYAALNFRVSTLLPGTYEAQVRFSFAYDNVAARNAPTSRATLPVRLVVRPRP
ncbi:MAG: hypothetical protein ACT4P6_01115 [Gemmatimonadaceae bacterium]